MPTDSEYGDDIRLLDDLTRLKLKLIDRRLKPSSAPRFHHRRAHSPEYTPTPPIPQERRRDHFYRRIDKRNELLQKLWEELEDGGGRGYGRRHPSYLPPLTAPRFLPRRDDFYDSLTDENIWNKTGNTKKDLMELMLIQNAQMQQWMMTQTMQRGLGDNGQVHHNHYYDAQGRPLPPIRKADAGSQYPQDFFYDQQQQPQQAQVGTNYSDFGQYQRENSSAKGKSRRKRR